MAQYQTFAEARVAGVLSEATRAGITKESVGQWMGLAVRYRRLGSAEEATCLRRAITIHEEWGSLYGEYGFSPDGSTERHARHRLAELERAG